MLIDAADAIRALLAILGEDPEREGLQKTPDRAARFFAEMTTYAAFEWTTFDAEGTDEMIVIGSIPFYSLCEHHLLPFFGTATIGYVPNGRIVGLSKIPRLLKSHASGLQNQERITQRVAGDLMESLKPKGAGVVLHARHLCMEMRGVRTAGAVTTTSALRGVFLDDARCRREFLDFDARSPR